MKRTTHREREQKYDTRVVSVVLLASNEKKTAKKHVPRAKSWMDTYTHQSLSGCPQCNSDTKVQCVFERRYPQSGCTQIYFCVFLHSHFKRNKFLFYIVISRKKWNIYQSNIHLLFFVCIHFVLVQGIVKTNKEAKTIRFNWIWIIYFYIFDQTKTPSTTTTITNSQSNKKKNKYWASELNRMEKSNRIRTKGESQNSEATKEDIDLLNCVFLQVIRRISRE